ncbi:ATP-binding protein [Halovenus rubra]|uniref:histidine kinase n=2 Tax=Halovenus rubra TaxID=869890 RepID=A0ABD5X4Z7_9EURY|nr:ATP-binding protein [Halovenus rubra]
MTAQNNVGIVHEYINIAHTESRVAAAERYLAEDATVVVNGTSMTSAEYVAEIGQSDRSFVPTETEINQTVVEDNTVVVRAVSKQKQVEPAYGIEPTDGEIETHFSVFHRIVDEEITRMVIVVDEMAKFRQLGLLSEDPTREQLQDQYYQVLNRVLRHDLRNRLNVIRLAADSLAENHASDPVVAGVKIRAVVDELLQTTDKARALEQLAIDAPLESTTFQIDSLVNPVLQKYNESTDAVCTAEYPDDVPSITTDKKLLWNALNELLENSLLYNDRDETQITVVVREVLDSQYNCELQIEDNGPQIPAEVLKPIEENEETELLHGSGIGLWIVKWCLTRLDGELSFEQCDDDGTRVRMLLPNLD